MATAKDPQASPPPPDAVTASPTPPASIKVGPPPQKPPAPRDLRRVIGQLDGLLVGAVLLLAFLTASFPVYNSDFFQQAALGRLVVEHRYQPWTGVDPLSFTTRGVYWVNHSWLYDVLVYGLYSIPQIGGIVLVVVKALLLTLLAELMLRVAWRPKESLWLAALCVGLAVLVMSPRFFLQPACVSIVLLGVTLWLLRRPAEAPGRAPRAWWWLPPLFALWVNLDDWFLLGPITVALYLAGAAVDRALARDDGERVSVPALRALGLVLLTGVAACLVNPYHVWAFTPPAQLGLSAAAEAVRNDPQFRGMFLSPFGPTYFEPWAGLSVAGLAYYPLLVLGAVSFLLAWPKLRGWRVALWVGFALLSAWHGRAIPFFAVVAGPVAALNLNDFAAGRRALSPRAAVAGRWVSLLAVLSLLVAAVPGWLEATPHEWRRVSWGVVPDPSLKQLAETIRKKIDKGDLPPDIHWFNTTPESAYYLAWFCPGQRTFCDQRLTPFDRVAGEYVAARRSLAGLDGDGKKDSRAWSGVFDKHGVTHVVHSEPDPGHPSAVLRRMLATPEEWVPPAGLFPVGRAGVFGWQNPGAPRAAQEFGRRLNRLAFGPDAEPAPRSRPREPRRPGWWGWEALWRPEPARAVETYEGQMYLALFGQLSGRDLQGVHNLWEAGRRRAVAGAMAAGPFAVRLVPPPPPFDVFRAQFDDRPQALYLALRCARRGLAANPDDARAWYLLGRVYASLAQDTHERVLAPPELRLIRQAQALAALRQAVELDPDLYEAHFLLMLYYDRVWVFSPGQGLRGPGGVRPPRQLRQVRYLDLELKHLREVVRLLPGQGRLVGEADDAFQKRLQEAADAVTHLEKDLDKTREEYRIRSAGERTSVIDKALIARSRGLAETALEELDKASGNDLSEAPAGGPPAALGAVVKLELLLDMGRPDLVRQSLGIDEKDKADFIRALGGIPEVSLAAYDWLLLQAAAAQGDYDEADEVLARNLADLRGPGKRGAATNLAVNVVRSVVPALIPEAMEVSGLGALGLPVRVPWWVPAVGGRFLSVGLGIREAEVLTLRGWLALEAGAMTEARRHLEDALHLATPGIKALPPLLALVGTPGRQLAGRLNLGDRFDFGGRPLAQIGVEWLRAAAR
jgi:tetratricopeptide (TPR) repeat protein